MLTGNDPIEEKPPRSLLLVEDDENDQELELRALRKAWPSLSVTVASDGAEATNYLFGQAPRMFDMILLDIKLPFRSGIELLQDIRSDARYELIPVVMLTSSAELSDVRRCYQLGANSFVQKALEYEVLMRNIRLCAEYWLSVNIAPK